jgi:hypothetical protein
VLSQGFWPACIPDLNSFDLYLLGTIKDKVSVNNPYSI